MEAQIDLELQSPDRGGRLAGARLVDSAPSLRAEGGLRLISVSPPLLSETLLPGSSFPGGDDWASGGAIGRVFAHPFADDERILPSS